MYIVRLFSTDESMGKVTLGKAYAGYLDRVTFEYTPLLGYKYSSNTCGMLNDGNTLTLLSVTDDIDCYVSFEKDMKKITFDNDGGSGCISASIQKGQAYGNLCTPSKNNYTFDGWYTSKTYETKIESTDIVNDDITLYAKWKINKIVYTNLSISCSNYSKGNYPYMFVYTGKCSIHNDGNDNWRIKFLTSGSLTSSISIKADVFVVGGGGGGGSVRFYDIYYGGNGSLIWFPRANGGAGGGGYGGGSNGPATSGKENTGGGGGGGTGEHNGGYTAGASGGSGIVVIRNVR